MSVCLIIFGHRQPPYADGITGMWLLLSGVVGFFGGDFCLYGSNTLIDSRHGMLCMAQASMFSTLVAWAALGQVLALMSLLAMADIGALNRPHQR